MRTWIALLVVLAVIAAALVLGLGLLDDENASDPVGPDGGESLAPPREETGEGDTEPILRHTVEEPEGMPALEALPVRDALGILLLAGVPQRFNRLLAQQWGLHEQMTVTSWAAPLPDGVREGVLSAEVLPGLLSEPPRRVTFDDEEIDVVVVHDLDPSVLDRDFWLEVVKRVDDGRLGLLVVPGQTSGRLLLDHDVLSTVLPVGKAAAIEGQPVPGTFRGLASYVPTDAGVRHPATRLVSWPTWSRRIWNSRAQLEDPWGTRVCYPVEEVPAGASVLLDAKPAAGEAYPALIAGVPAQGRVLWFGGWDLGSRKAYGRPRVVEEWGLLVDNWVAWLGGQVED